MVPYFFGRSQVFRSNHDFSYNPENPDLVDCEYSKDIEFFYYNSFEDIEEDLLNGKLMEKHGRKSWVDICV